MLFEVFLLKKVTFESDNGMKEPCITREQSLGIHVVVNDQGFAMHFRAISYKNQYCSKAKGQIDFFSYVECFRSKDLSIRFSRRT